MTGEATVVPSTPANPPADSAMNSLPQTLGTPEPTPEPTQPPAELTDEQKRIAALEANLAAMQAQNAQLLQLAMRPVQQPVAPTPEPAEFDLEGLPDPVQAPKDFTTQLTQRIRQRDAQRDQRLTQNITTQVSRGAALDALYNRFTVQQPELAKRQALLQGAASVEFQRLQQQGIDPVTVAQQNPDSLIGLIAQRMTAELGGAPVAQQPGTPGSAARVAGLPGGSNGTTRPTTKAPATKGFTDQIKEQQQKMGLL